NCAAPSGVPNVISAGGAHVIVGVSRFAEAVTVTPVDVVWRPAASRARAASVCAPLASIVESQRIAYGAAVTSAPSAEPSSRNWPPAPPMSSDAVAATTPAAPETGSPLAGAIIETVGAAWSTLTVLVLANPVAPVVSRATADRKWV